MKRKDLLKEVRGQDEAGLNKKLLTLSEEIMKLRFRKATGQLQQNHLISQMKKQVAIVKTVIKEKVKAASKAA